MSDILLWSFLVILIIGTSIMSLIHFFLLFIINRKVPPDLAKSKKLKTKYKDFLKVNLVGFIIWFILYYLEFKIW